MGEVVDMQPILKEVRAAESAARAMLAKYENAPCDSPAVASCVRCNSVFLAKFALASLTETEGSAR